MSYDDLEQGKVFISEHNGVTDPFSTQFFVSALGPDCRIYIRPGSSSYSFHVIHEPNEKGLDCNLEQQGIALPEVSSVGSFPNFPRFRVDEEEKCDPNILSVLGEEVFWTRDLKIYPNPASDLINMEFPENTHGELYIVDINGKIVLHQMDFRKEQILNVTFLSAGTTYSVHFVPENNVEQVVYVGHFVKVASN